jgi:glutamate racemase
MEAGKRPIGVFDSGVGGLTVAHAIRQSLPDERIVYFGDTAHLPYGDKSEEAIRNYSRRIADFLLGYDAKLILIACNSASASAYENLLAEYGERVPVLDVINPVVEHVVSGSYRKLGVIGTKRTITSGTYEKKLHEASPSTEVVSLATPLLVPMIEEGFIFDDISNAIIRTYLSDSRLEDIDALILGCTHYPIIRNQISKYFNVNVEVVDSARIVAVRLREVLERQGLLNRGKAGQDLFFVSDYTDYFEKIARMFFENNINLQKADIWS